MLNEITYGQIQNKERTDMEEKTAQQKQTTANAEHRLSRVGQWLRSERPPIIDLSGLSDKEQKIMMKLILK